MGTNRFFSGLSKLLVCGFAALPILFFSTKAQAQNCIWADGAGGNEFATANSLVTDANGYVYATGYYQSATIVFGTTTLTNMSTAGTRDLYLVKYDSIGNVVWAKSAGGANDEYANSVAVDTSGNIYVIGSYSSSTMVIGGTTLTNAGGYDVFLLKYDPSGSVVWAKSFGSSGNDEGRGVAVDASGNLLVTGGYLSATLTWGATVLTNVSSGSADVFLAKLTPDGSVVWAKSAGGSGYDDALSVAVDNQRNVFVTGYYYSPTMTFSPIAVTNAGHDDMYLVKYDSTGTIVWATSVGDTGYEYGTSVAIDPSGNVLVGGGFSSPSVHIGTTTLTSMGNSDAFVAKYNNSGTAIWANSAGGTNLEHTNCIAVDNTGGVYLTGYFYSGTLDAGSATVTNSASGTPDIFLVKYAATGVVQWGTGYGGSSDDRCNSVATGLGGQIYIGGYYTSATAHFGSVSVTDVDTSANMFVARIAGTPVGTPILINEKEGVIIYPNPSNGILNVVVKNSGYVHLSIVDCLGKDVYSSALSGTGREINLQIDLGNCASGVYFMRLKGVDGYENVPFVVKR